jgi:exodeoxyribonuclease VII small subunit
MTMPAKKTTATKPAASEEGGPTFEEALERLETIVEELEGGALSLEESLGRYEEGVKLSRRLTQTLDQAEKRIERLVEDDGEPTTTPMELKETGGALEDKGGSPDDAEGRLPF